MRLSPDGPCALIGMVHALPLPGSPRWGGALSPVIAQAEADARTLLAGGCDALLVENMHDRPYLRGRVPPETTAAMAVVVARVAALGRPTGVQILAGANREALGVALAAGASFIRVEAFAYGHLADEGWMDACAGALLRVRASLGADVAIWADVRKKHAAHAATADLSLADLARGTAFCEADALILTGDRTGAPTDPDDLVAAAAAGLPLAVGSGVTAENVHRYAPHAQALIVGSWLKEGGDWRRPVDPARVRALRTRLDEVQATA
ncbi:MAG: BtpA/SgcQ family protein [Alphaproteobacteria bacterium]|nr:BtpA/SgcQ family protein [Alphaproteobacteria bacterium]